MIVSHNFVHSVLTFEPDDGDFLRIGHRSIEAVPWLDPADGTCHLGCVRVDVIDPKTANDLEPGTTGRLAFESKPTPLDGAGYVVADDFGRVRVAGRFPSGSVETGTTWMVVFEPIDRPRARRAEL